jgi:hypothetical protein
MSAYIEHLIRYNLETMSSTDMHRNDMILLEARIATMRRKDIILSCPNCMSNSNNQRICPTCRHGSGYPSAYSSQAEWNEELDENVLDISCFPTNIFLKTISNKTMNKCKTQK